MKTQGNGGMTGVNLRNEVTSINTMRERKLRSPARKSDQSSEYFDLEIRSAVLYCIGETVMTDYLCALFVGNGNVRCPRRSI
jgi:hypothetical protein